VTWEASGVFGHRAIRPPHPWPDSVPSLYCNPGNNLIHFLSGTSPYVTISWLPIRCERERERRRPHLSKLLILNEWLFHGLSGSPEGSPISVCRQHSDTMHAGSTLSAATLSAGKGLPNDGGLISSAKGCCSSVIVGGSASAIPRARSRGWPPGHPLIPDSYYVSCLYNPFLHPAFHRIASGAITFVLASG